MNVGRAWNDLNPIDCRDTGERMCDQSRPRRRLHLLRRNRLRSQHERDERTDNGGEHSRSVSAVTTRARGRSQSASILTRSEVTMVRTLTARLLFVISVVTCAALASAQTPTPTPAPAATPAPSPTPVTRSAPAGKDELAAISARGKALAEYDEAAWHASDAAASIFQSMTTKGLYVADKAKGKWVVYFGKFNSDARDQFLVLVEATQKKDVEYTTTRHDTPKVETGRVLDLARAAATCRDQFKGENRPYNIAVLPGEKNKWWVYVLPAQTTTGIFPIGGDVRYTVSPDGKTILDTHPMHVVVQEFKGAPLQPTAPAMLVRTAVLDDAPEDSDVFFAMSFKPSTPHLIITRNFVYQVAPTGQIQYLAKTSEFIKR